MVGPVISEIEVDSTIIHINLFATRSFLVLLSFNFPRIKMIYNFCFLPKVIKKFRFCEFFEISLGALLIVQYTTVDNTVQYRQQSGQ